MNPPRQPLATPASKGSLVYHPPLSPWSFSSCSALPFYRFISSSQQWVKPITNFPGKRLQIELIRWSACVPCKSLAVTFLIKILQCLPEA